MLESLDNIGNFLEDIKRLEKRSSLLNDILNYYDKETMTFNIPAKWKGKVRIDKLPAESPRHLMHKKIKEKLSIEELCWLGIYDNI